MRRSWDQREMSPGIEENISTWKNRRKQKSINMLDLNESPNDNHLFSEKVKLELKATKLVESENSAKDRPPFLSANKPKFAAPYCRPRGVLKMKASDHLEQSDIVPTGVQPDFPAGTHGIRDFKFCPLPASLCFQNTGGLHEYPFLRQRAEGSRVFSPPDQPPFLMDPQESVRVTSNHPESSTRKVKLETLSSLDDNSVLGKHKLFGVDMGRFLNKECKSSLDTVGAMPLTSASENQRANVGREFNGSYPRSLESSPFRIQYVGNGKQETLMGSFSHQNNGESDVSIRKSEKLSSKSSVSEAFKDQKSLPLTYKRRKVVTTANSLNFGKSLTAGADLKSAIPNESNQDFREGVKTVKIKLMGCP
ncbi:NFRKB-RELATED [Salix viminalis]|uniref:NFRKB-RELATED n=1 Tax=Salix viminalis TaxID=40686 RepID=A0A9Q0NSH2_SALVM|nr:NFRKB-RELATED [Salix viminalis]